MEPKEKVTTGAMYPLHEASNKGKLEEVERLLAYGICLVNEIDQFGQTALHIASFEGHIDIVNLLIKKMAFLSIQDKNGWTPLHSASSSGNLEICEILIREGADPNVQSISKSTPLHYLTSLPCSDMLLFVMHLIINSSDLLNLKNEFGVTPLHNACLRNGEAIVLYLLCNGADPNVANNQNEAPIHVACSAGKIRLVQLLIDFGANIRVKGPDGTPEETAARYNHIKIVEFLKSLRSKRKLRSKEKKLSRLRNLDLKLSGQESLSEEFKVISNELDNDSSPRSNNSVSNSNHIRHHSRESYDSLNEFNEGEDKRNSYGSTTEHISESNDQNSNEMTIENRERSSTIDSSSSKSQLNKAKKRRNSLHNMKRKTSKLDVNDIFCIKEPSYESTTPLAQDRMREPCKKKPIPFSKQINEFNLISELELKRESDFGYCDILQEGDIIENCDGWCALIKHKSSRSSKLFIEDDEITSFHYKDNFFTKQNALLHYNFVGYAKGNTLEYPEPIIISVLPKDSMYWGICRTSKGDLTFHVDTKTRKGYSSKKILKLLEDYNQSIKDSKLIVCKDSNIVNELLEFEKTEKNQFKKINSHKIGILYVKEGQKTEEDILGNKSGSAHFKEFLNFLGETVNLEGFEGFNGGLDIKKNRSGKQSVYTRWFDFEIMFHVSTFLPLLSGDEKYVEKKKHIGNDMTCIVFIDGDNKFNPATITSNFLHVFLVIQSLGNSQYKVAITRKNGVPEFGPPLPASPIFSKDEVFRDFLLSKIVNAERATLNGPLFKNKRRNARRSLLEMMIKNYL